jgi:UDP-sugar transporter A1/2/3
LVALSIKYGDAILKTLATTAAIILSSVLDWALLSGPLTPVMCIAGVQVIIAICDYTFDPTPPEKPDANGASMEMSKTSERPSKVDQDEEAQPLVGKKGVVVVD